MGCISKNLAVNLVNYGILRPDQTRGVLGDGAEYLL
jgi:hypothetical protein